MARKVLPSFMITAADVREVAMALPRTSEHLIRDHVKFRVGAIVYASISPDESTVGQREGLKARCQAGKSAGTRWTSPARSPKSPARREPAVHRVEPEQQGEPQFCRAAPPGQLLQLLADQGPVPDQLILI